MLKPIESQVKTLQDRYNFFNKPHRFAIGRELPTPWRIRGEKFLYG